MSSDFKIEGLGRAVAILGKDLNFHDAEILSVFADRQGPSITLKILTSSQGESGKSYVMSLRFDDVTSVEMEDFNHQNVIQSFRFGQGQGGLQAEIVSLFGATISFGYQIGHVLDVQETTLRLGNPL